MEKFTISQKMDSFGTNKFTWKMFFLLGLAMIFDGYDYMIVSYTLPQIKIEWGLSGGLAGSLSSWSMMGMIVGGAISGVVSDKIGRKKMLTFAIIIYSLLNLPLFWSTGFEMFAFFRVAAGVGLGACIPVVTTMFAESTPTKRRAWFITFGMAFMIVGWTLAGVIGRAVVTANPDNWRYCYLIAFVPFIYGIILFFNMRESAYWLAGKGRKAEAIEEIKRIERQATGKVGDYNAEMLEIPVIQKNAKKLGPAALFSRKYIMATSGVWITYFCGCFVVYGVNAWLPQIMIDKGFEVANAYALSSAQNAASVIANISVGFLAELIGRKKNLIISFLVAAAAVFIMSNVGDSFGIVLAANIFLGFAMNYSITCVQPLMAEAYPTEIRNTGVSWCQAFGRVAGMIAPVVAGILHARGSGDSSSIFLFFMIPPVIGAIAGFIFIKRETKGKSLDQLASEDATDSARK
ncbi:MAG: MFS transporter [Clostridiales Family XIII bacterium]|jgi:MFS family permease|nr:MFS transporter [Clostridiales Family XIII bacterium]